MSYTGLQPLRGFSVLLTETEGAIVVDMVKNCTDKKDVMLVAAAASSASSSSSCTAREFESTAMKETLDMFY